MKQIEFSKHFSINLKKLARRKPDVIATLLSRVLVFQNDIREPSLRLHKLSGKLENHWAFSIEEDLRIIFRYKSDGNILFVAIGTHDEVY